MTPIHILFLQSGPAMPDTTGKIKSKYDFFSSFASGIIVTPVAREERFLKVKGIGKFELYSFYYDSGNFLIRNFKYMFHVFRAVSLYKKKKRLDLIVSPNPLFCGVIALIIGAFTGAKVLIEVNGNFEAAFVFGTKNTSGWLAQLKHKLSMLMIPFVLKQADMVKLVYKNQLSPLGISGPIECRSFPNFVPINSFLEADIADGGYLLLIGYPWYLKGVDILINAFKLISHKFPDMRLKIVGWCPDGYEYFAKLAKGNPRIELCGPVEYEEVIPLVANCSVYVLASRTDSSPRVLREAMACRKPIVASAVDGVPELIEDGINGLLFETDNVEELAEKLTTLLSNRSLSDYLAANGYNFVKRELSETRYIEKYQKMIAEMYV